MLRALYSAATGMEALQINIDNIAHNIANVNTTGFKQRRTQFQDLLYQDLVAPGSNASSSTEIPTGLQIGLGTRAVSNEIIFTQGDFVSTGNQLDIVIAGRGFFQVRIVVTVSEDALKATMNLLAPVVVNSRNSKAAQIVLVGQGYPIERPLMEPW